MHKKPKKKTFLHYCDLDKKKKCKVAPSIWVSLPQRSGFSWKPAFCFLFCRFSSAAFAAVLFYFFFFGQLANHNRPVHYFGFSLLLFVIVRRFLFFSIASFCPSTHCVLIFIYIPAKKKQKFVCERKAGHQHYSLTSTIIIVHSSVFKTSMRKQQYVM